MNEKQTLRKQANEAIEKSREIIAREMRNIRTCNALLKNLNKLDTVHEDN